MKEDDKEKLRLKVMSPDLPYLSKKSLKKKIVTLAKKQHWCFKCGAPNGIVKKCGMLKIAHDRFRHAKKSEQFREFQGKIIIRISGH